MKGMKTSLVFLLLIVLFSVSAFAESNFTNTNLLFYNLSNTGHVGNVIIDSAKSINGSATSVSFQPEYTSFDGSTSYINMDSTINPSSITVSVWYRSNSTTGEVIGNYGGSGESNHLEVFARGSDQDIGCYIDSGTSGSSALDSNVPFADGNWHHVVCTYDATDGSTELFVDNVSRATGSFAGGIDFSQQAFAIGRRQTAGDTYLNGDITGVSIYSSPANITFVNDLYNEGLTFDPYSVEPTPPPAELRFEEMYQVTQPDLVTITLDDVWTPIFNWQYALPENYTNYGSTTIQTLSNSVNTNFSCRTVIDGNPTGDDVNRTNIPGEIGSLTIMRPDVNVSGNYAGEVQCKKSGGTTFINFSNGVGHVFSDNVTSQSLKTNVVVNGVNQTIGTYPINSTYDGKLVLETAGTMSSPNAQIVETSISTSDGQECGVNYRELAGNDEGAIGGLCSIDVTAGNQILVYVRATGNNVTLDYFTHAKVLSNANSSALLDVNITDTQTLVGRVLVNNTQRLGKVFMKTNIPIRDSTQTVDFQFAVDGVLVGQVVPYTSGSLIKQNIVQYLADAPDKDFFNVSIYGTSQTSPITDIEVMGGNLLAYVGNEYDVNNTFVTITAKNIWNNSAINDFSVTDGTTIYSTNDGSLDIFTSKPLLNLTFSSDGYLNKTYLDVNTSTPFEAELGQSEVKINATSSFGNQKIEYFEVQTGYGIEYIFVSEDGIVNLEPNLGNYSWNISFDSYFNLTNINFSIDEIYKNFTLENNNDTVIKFNDAESSTPLSNANVILTYYDGRTFNLTTNSSGEVRFAGYRVGNYSVYNLTLKGFDGYITPITFEVNDSVVSLPLSRTYDVERANIIINIFDRDTFAYILQEVNVSIQGIGTFSTSNGILNLSNQSIVKGNYTILADSNNYLPNQKTFSFSGQEELNLSVYLMNENTSNLGRTFVTVFDAFYNTQIGADVRLQEYVPSLDAFIEVSQCLTDSNGECIFDVELDEKRYKIIASKTINGILFNAQSTEEGALIKVDNTVFELHLNTEATFQSQELTDLYITVEDIELVNDSISVINVEFNNRNGQNIKVCLEYFYYDGLIKKSIPSSSNPTCLTDSSGELNVDGGFALDRNYTNVVEVYAVTSEGKVPYFSKRYSSNGSFESAMGDLLKPLILFLNISMLALAIYLKRIELFAYGSIVLSFLSTILAPSLTSGAILSISVVMNIFIIYLARKREAQFGV